MRKIKLTRLFFLILLLIGCSKEKRMPSEGEALLMKRLNAEDVCITINQTQTTSDGIVTNKESFLLVELDKPQVLLKAKGNEAIYKEQCDNLKNFILDSLSLNSAMKFDEIRFKIIEKHKIFIFTDELFEIITYH